MRALLCFIFFTYSLTLCMTYLEGNELEELAKDVGFSEAKHYEIGSGFMGTLVARR